MASYGPRDSEDAVKVYTTDTIVDHPGAKIVYKGLVTIEKGAMDVTAEITHLIGEAKLRAKELNANAIVGMKITDSKNGGGGDGYTFIGTAVRYST